MLVRMTDLASRSDLLVPPSERPAGHRGPRGPIAAVAALAGIIPLTWAQSFDETSWGAPTMLAAGASLVAGAVLLWTARRRVAVGAAAALVLLGAVGGAVAIAAEFRTESRRMAEEDRLGGAVFDEPRARGPRLTKAQAEAVPMGLTREQLRSRLGAPATHGIQRITDGPDMRCWAYRSPDTHPRWPLLHAFCFRDGRYAELTEW
jgi:hypothetical protein